jgi:hypothetical protein
MFFMEIVDCLVATGKHWASSIKSLNLATIVRKAHMVQFIVVE